MEHIEIEVQEARELAQEANALLIQAKTYHIANPDQYQAAASELLRIKTVRTRIAEVMDPVVAAAHQTHKLATGKRAELMAPLDEAERAIKLALGAYDQEQRRKAAEEEARLRAIAEAEAAKERARLAAQAEKALEKGKEDKAADLLDQAAAVIPMAPIVAPQVVKVAGVSSRVVWRARVVNPQTVPAYVGGVEIREINLGALNRLAAMTKGPSQIPGVEFYEETQIAAASGR